MLTSSTNRIEVAGNANIQQNQKLKCKMCVSILETGETGILEMAAKPVKKPVEIGGMKRKLF